MEKEITQSVVSFFYFSQILPILNSISLLIFATKPLRFLTFKKKISDRIGQNVLLFWTAQAYHCPSPNFSTSAVSPKN